MFDMDNREIVGGGAFDAPTMNDNPPDTATPCHPPLHKGGTPSATATDSAQPECETVGGGAFDAPTVPPEVEPIRYVDLNREEFVAFRMLTGRLFGPLRQRIPTLVVSILCCLMLGGYAIFEWWAKHWYGYPDPVLVAGAVLVLVPALIVCGYMPWKMKRDAGKQYDRSVQAGMDFCGELTVYPDCIEKAGQTVTASIRIDQRMLFIETPDMMVITAVGSPAIVLPARCLTEGMAATVRQAVERLPIRNRKFVGRVQCRGEMVPAPKPTAKPEELWVSTFTYTAEEYATVLRSIIQQHFWRMAPLLATVSVMGALAFGYNGVSLIPCIGYFVAFMAVLILFNLVLPLRRVKSQAETLSPHDLTMQVRFDTMALRVKLPKGGENWVLWCDVDHVYDREDFVEVVHNKHSSLYIPKRVIDDLDALDAVIKRCRGEQ